MKNIIFSISLFCAICQVLGASAQKLPNVLWLVIEDTSPQFIGCYGNNQAKTPNIDRLSKDGIRFVNAFSTGTVCAPSRCTIITGARTFEMGTENHRSNYPIPAMINGFPSYLRNVGYYTTNNYKTDYNTSNAAQLIRSSWDESSDKAGWWNRKPGQPFFSVFNFMDSHQSRTMTNPYDVYKKQVLDVLPIEKQVSDNVIEIPPFFRDSKEMRHELARIYNSISLADHKLGLIIEKLRKDNLLDSTIIFFYADHGEGMPRAKTNGIDLGYRVPFVVWFPEMYKKLSPWGKGGVVTNEMINFSDLAPTLLNLAGVKIPSYMHGRVFLGKGSQLSPKSMFLSSGGSEGVSELTRTVTNGRFSYSRIFMPFMPELYYKKYFEFSDILQFMRRDLKNGVLSNVQAMSFQPRDAEYLFDFENDPWQLNNLAHRPEYQMLLKEMRSETEKNIIKNRDVMFLPGYEMDKISSNSNLYDFRMNDKDYPIKEIYRAASLSGIRTTRSLKQQVVLLRHFNPIVRYWAALGLRSQGIRVKDYKKLLFNALDDNYPPVKIIVASILYDQFADSKAAAILKEAITGRNGKLTKLAIQMVQYQKYATEFIGSIEMVLESTKHSKHENDVAETAEIFLNSIKGTPLKYQVYW